MDDRELLREYAERRSQEAFRQLVYRHLPMVYSAARRLVRDPHLAEDVAQGVFTTLAQKAESLGPPQVVGGWLYNTTRHLALHAVRAEHRRREREQTAAAMQILDLAPDDPRIAEHLEPAMAELEPADRDALVLRYLENRSLRDVGAELGLSEDAARMKVNRALERLRAGFERQGVGITAVLLATAITATTTVVPSGLAATVATTALAATAVQTSAALATTQAIAMTTLQKTLVAAAIVAVSVTATLLVQHPVQSKLRAENDALRRLQVEQADHFAAEAARLSNQLARVRSQTSLPSNGPSTEVLKLRGEVGRLRQEKAAAGTEAKSGPSLLSGLTDNPEMRKAFRIQQKAGMGILYKDFAKRLNLPKEQTEKFTDVLADDIMENVDHITALLRDRKSPEEMETVFAGQEAALRDKVEAMLGPEGVSQYQEYSRNLLSKFSAEEFKEMLTGDNATKEAQAMQLSRLLQQETLNMLAEAGLSPDYQTLPILNFRNIASAEEAEKNLKLLESIYERAGAKAGSFLSAEELAKFSEYRAAAISASRAMLLVNRKMMSPGSR
jgi:RNA polymerase sigma factor (sigma-70 family)